MKNVSIFFSIVILFPITFFSLHIFQLYDSKGPLKYFGVNDELITSLARPSIIWLIIYAIVFSISIFLDIKKKYVANTIFSSIMIIIYMCLTLLVRFS